MTATREQVDFDHAQSIVAEALELTKKSDTPFQFNKFPIIIPVAEIFKVRGDTEERYICMEFINKQLRAIRRDGNWPKDLLRVENLELRIAGYLLSQQDKDPDLYMYGDIFFYMEAPSDDVWVVSKLVNSHSRTWTHDNLFGLVVVDTPSEKLNF